MSLFLKCFFIVVLLGASNGTSGGEETEGFATQEWLEENAPELDEEQRTTIANSLLSVVDEFGVSLTDQQRAAILGSVPPYLGEIRSTKEYGLDFALELLQERYRCAIRDYVERPELTEEEQRQIERQRDSVFVAIREEAAQLAENAPSDQAAQNLWSLIDSLEEKMIEQSRNPLSPYFKKLLDPSEFDAWVTDIRDEFTEYAASPPEPRDGRPVMLEDGIPVEWMSLIQQSYGGDRFSETESPELRNLMKKHMEASEAQMLEEERKNTKAWQERVKQSELHQELSMAASELDRRLSEDRVHEEAPVPQENVQLPASVNPPAPADKTPVRPNSLLPLALAIGAGALLCAIALGIGRARYRKQSPTRSTGGHS